MSRRTNAVPSWVSSFAVAYVVGASIRDRRLGVRAGLVAATVAAAVSWVVSGLVEAAEARAAVNLVRDPTNPTAGAD